MRTSVDTEQLDGLFSGYNPKTGAYDTTSWATREWRGACSRTPDVPCGQREVGAGWSRARRSRRVAGAQRRPARRDAAGSVLRLSNPQAPLRPLHAGDGRADLRCFPRAVRESLRGGHHQQRSRAHYGVGLLGGLDAALRRCSVHPRRGDHPVAAGQHGPARRRHPRSARSREHPGLDGHPNTVRSAPRISADAACRRARQPRRIPRFDQERRAEGILDSGRRVHGEPVEGMVRRRGHEGQ